MRRRIRDDQSDARSDTHDVTYTGLIGGPNYTYTASATAPAGRLRADRSVVPVVEKRRSSKIDTYPGEN